MDRRSLENSDDAMSVASACVDLMVEKTTTLSQIFGKNWRVFWLWELLLAGGIVWSIVACSQDVRPATIARVWDEFNRHNYREAIRASSSCVEQYGRQAVEIQERLEIGADRPIIPGTYNPTSVVAKKTFSHGILNDVAACLFVMGTSQEITGQCAEARETYNAAIKLTYARIWDPQGWFWAPDKAALDGLDRIRRQC